MAQPDPRAAAVRSWLKGACRATNRPPDGHPLPEVPEELMGAFLPPGGAGELFRCIGSRRRARRHFSEIWANHYGDALLASLELMCAGMQVPLHLEVDVGFLGPEARADATPLDRRSELTAAVREELRRAKDNSEIGFQDDSDSQDEHEAYEEALEDVLAIAARLEEGARRRVNADLRQRTGTDFAFA
jgi:hypothetical protein